MISGAEQIARVLSLQGIGHIFVLSGGHVSPIFVECKKSGIRVVDARDEKNAAFAADASARLSGIPGVAVVTAGPGLSNTITAVKNAQMAQSPLIILGGATATLLKGRGSLQDIDQAALLGPHVKGMCRVSKLRELIPALQKAFRVSQEGTPGPFFVELPVDILYPESIVREWYNNDIRPPKNLGQRIQNAYIRYHLNSLFRGSENPILPDKKTNVEIPLADEGALQKSAGMWTRARRPLIIIGSQAMNEPALIPDMIAAIEKSGAAVYLSGMARGLLGKDHPQQFRHKRKEALKEADLVLLAGLPCDFRMDYGRSIRSPFISVNRDRGDLYLNRRPDLPVQADAAHFLVALAEKLPASTPDRREWLSALQKRENEREAEISKQAEESLEGGMNPVALFRELDKHILENSILIADGGDFVGTASYILRPRSPLSWLDPGAFGTLGVGGGFAMGAKCTRPESEVWIIWGDGSCAYSLAEFEAMARQGLPVIGLVGNDAAWGQILRDQVPLLGDAVAAQLSRTDYHEVAKGYGGEGICISRVEELPSAIEKARESIRRGKPFLINALIGKSEFRKGSISI